MFENGAQILKVDFHMHTNRDKEFSYTGDSNYYVSDYISRMEEKDIRVGVITNHNKFDKTEYTQLRKTAKKKDIYILPGVELSIKEGANGIHALIVFNPNQWLANGNNNIEVFLNEVFRDTHNRENENTRCQCDLLQVIEKLDRYHSDYFIVFAHVEDKNGFLKECNGGLVESLAQNPLFKKSVLGFQKVRTRKIISDAELHMGYELPHLEGSDCKNIETIGKDRGFSYIKLGDYSFQALKFALQAHEDRVFSERTIYKRGYISDIAFEGGLLDGTQIGLSPELNTFIGIRGSGKSSIIELIRYALDLRAIVDEDYKNNLVKYILESGGVVSLMITDEYGKRYNVRRILGEPSKVYDEQEHELEIAVTDIIHNPVYFGQKDLALTKVGYELELLNKLLGEDIFDEKKVHVCLNTLRRKLSEWFELETIPEQIEDLKAKIAQFDHKLKIFDERGVSAKLKKQVSYSSDSLELKSIIKNCKSLLQRANDLFEYYDDLSIITDGYSSEYNQEFFAKVETSVSSIKKHFENIRLESKAIEKNISNLCEFEEDLATVIEKLKEEFAEIRRELRDTQLDIDAYGKYRDAIDSCHRELGLKENYLARIEPLKKEILNIINSRTGLLFEKYALYEKKIARVNESQEELSISINFRGEKSKFVEQLQTHFKGSGITEIKYKEIAEVFSDFVDLIADVLFHNGKQLQTIITSHQFTNVYEKIKMNYQDYISLETPNKIEIKYHGKLLSRHSTGQRASALALFILAQKDNDVIIIDQPEDDLDNQVIYTEFIKRVKEKKESAQFIFATHNANIPVLGDADRVVAAVFEDSNMDMQTGTIDDSTMHTQIINIMEGGKEAFERRNAIYNSWT